MSESSFLCADDPPRTQSAPNQTVVNPCLNEQRQRKEEISCFYFKILRRECCDCRRDTSDSEKRQRIEVSDLGTETINNNNMSTQPHIISRLFFQDASITAEAPSSSDAESAG